MQGDDSTKEETREPLPSVVDRSAAKSLQGVERPLETDSMASLRLAAIQISSSPFESRTRQNSAPIPEEAPVTTAIPGIRPVRRRLR